MENYISGFFLLLIILPGLLAGGCSKKIEHRDSEWIELTASHTKEISMGNYQLEYIDIGQGEPVVMVHGFSLSAYSWRNNIRSLIDNRFRVILINWPGHGQTEIPPEPFTYSAENLADVIVTVTQNLGIERFNMIGHSLGGGLTLYTSFHNPQHILKSVVIDPPAFGAPRRLLLSYPGMATIASAIFGRWTVKMNMQAMYFDDKRITEVIVDEYARPIQKERYWQMLSDLSNKYFSLKFEQMHNNYHRTENPLLIVWGEKDDWLPLEIAYKLQNKIPNSKLLTVEDCGHNPHEECPEHVNAEVLSFLKNHQPDYK